VAAVIKTAMTRLLLDIDFATEPISGTLEKEDGAPHEFVGWLGLSELLGRLGRGEEVASPRPKGAGAQELTQSPTAGPPTDTNKEDADHANT
jgi:hypothetical protein